MAITTRIIGKLGGGVDIVDVSMSGTGSNVKHLLTRVEVPEGKQILVSVIGKFTATQSSNSRPDFDIGGFVSLASTIQNAHASASAILTESGDVNVITRGSIASSTFEGRVYTTEIH